MNCLNVLSHLMSKPGRNCRCGSGSPTEVKLEIRSRYGNRALVSRVAAPYVCRQCLEDTINANIASLTSLRGEINERN